MGVISSFKCGHLKFVQCVCISYVFLTMRRITISFFYNVSHRYSQLVTYTTVSSFLVCRLIWSLIKYIEVTLLSCLWPEWRQVSHSKGSHCWTVNALWKFRAFFFGHTKFDTWYETHSHCHSFCFCEVWWIDGFRV